MSTTALHAHVQRIVDELARDGNAAGTPKVELERPRDESHGDFATNAALLLAPVLRSNPREVATTIAERLREADGVAAVDVAGPGFINLTMHDGFFLDAIAQALAAGDTYGTNVVDTPRTMNVEFVSANPTGPIVAASARHAAFGDSLARVLRHAGHTVHTEYYVNDAGRQAQLFGESLIARAAGTGVPDGGYEGDYVAAVAADLDVAPGDDVDATAQRGVAAMLVQMRRTLDRLHTTFDHFQSERELHLSGAVDAGIEQLEESGHTWDEDGATMLRTTTWGDDRDRAVRRSNGVPTYFAADVAYLKHKFDRLPDGGHLIYVLGADHHGYVARLKGAALALGYDADAVEFCIMQMVTLVEGGETKRMSKRRGEFVTADELLDRIGADATRFWMLDRSNDQQLEIDLDQAEAQSDANPVFYVQYAHARLCSIRARIDADPGLVDTAADDAVGASLHADPLHASEKRLAKRLGEFPMIVREAADRRQPHRLRHYSYDVASDVAKFYRDCRVTGDGISPQLTARRLLFVDAARSVLALTLDLIGVGAPERMDRRDDADAGEQ